MLGFDYARWSEPAWRGLLWDAVLQEQFGSRENHVFWPPRRNERDAKSAEGFPPFEAVVKDR